jgi:hypothetical protein
MNRIEAEFVKAGARGITLTFASGDSGVVPDDGQCKNGRFAGQVQPRLLRAYAAAQSTRCHSLGCDWKHCITAHQPPSSSSHIPLPSPPPHTHTHTHTRTYTRSAHTRDSWGRLLTGANLQTLTCAPTNRHPPPPVASGITVGDWGWRNRGRWTRTARDVLGWVLWRLLGPLGSAHVAVGRC